MQGPFVSEAGVKMFDEEALRREPNDWSTNRDSL